MLSRLTTSGSLTLGRIGTSTGERAHCTTEGLVSSSRAFRHRLTPDRPDLSPSRFGDPPLLKRTFGSPGSQSSMKFQQVRSIGDVMNTVLALAPRAAAEVVALSYPGAR